jgi:hypothetical protein
MLGRIVRKALAVALSAMLLPLVPIVWFCFGRQSIHDYDSWD